MTAAPVTTPKSSAAVSVPQRVEIAERALIGKLLQLGNRGKAQADYERIADLKFSDFANRRNGLTFHAIKEIASRQETINITTIESELGKTLKDSTLRAIDEVTPTYLHSLIEGLYGDVDDSAKIIRKASWRRRVKVTARELEKLSENDSLTETEIMDAIVEQSEKLGQQAIALTGRTGVNLRDSVGEFWGRIEKQVADGTLSYGILTGLRAVDDFTKGFQRGKLYVLAGPTGMGKSALAIKIAKEAMHQTARVGFIPLEMSHEEMTSRFMAIESRIDGSLLQTGKLDQKDLSKLAESCRRIQGYQESQQFWYLEFNPRPNINDLRAKIAQHMGLYGADILIVDQMSIEAMSGTHPRMDEKEVLREIATGLKTLAEHYNIPIIVLAQLNRAGSGRDGQRPTLNNLAHSSSIENAAFAVMLLYRPNAGNKWPVEPMEIIWDKNRGGEKGIGEVNFIPALTDYMDIQS